MVLSLSMRRHLCHHPDGIVALIVMALLPSSMHMRLSVVDDDGDGVTGDDDDEFDNTTDFAIIVMALLPSLRWRRCLCRCAGILQLSTMMATAR